MSSDRDRPHLILRTLSRGDGLLGMRPHGKLGPRGDRVTLIRQVSAPQTTEHRLQWSRLPLQAVDPDMLQWRDTGIGRALTPSWTLEREDLFADFVADEVPRLRESGWQVEFAPGFAHHSQAIDGWQLDAVEADAADEPPAAGRSGTAAGPDRPAAGGSSAASASTASSCQPSMAWL